MTETLQKVSVLSPGRCMWCQVISSSTWWRHQSITEKRLFCWGQMPLIEGSWFIFTHEKPISGMWLFSELFDPPTYHCGKQYTNTFCYCHENRALACTKHSILFVHHHMIRTGWCTMTVTPTTEYNVWKLYPPVNKKWGRAVVTCLANCTCQKYRRHKKNTRVVQIIRKHRSKLWKLEQFCAVSSLCFGMRCLRTFRTAFVHNAYMLDIFDWSNTVYQQNTLLLVFTIVGNCPHIFT